MKANNSNMETQTRNLKPSANGYAPNVEVANIPTDIQTAIEIFGSEQAILKAAIEYIVAHSLLNDARAERENIEKAAWQKALQAFGAENSAQIAENQRAEFKEAFLAECKKTPIIRLEFKTPKPREKSAGKVKIERLQGSAKDIAAFKALAEKLGLKVS